MPRWKALSGALFRVLAVWLVSSLTLLVLAGLLPDFRLQAPGGDSLSRTALTAALGAGAFGLLSALVWPLLVRALLLVPALVLGLLVFFLNGSLLLLALDLIPAGHGQAAPETAVIVAAAMSAASSATSAFLAVRNDEAYHRRLVRLAGRRRGRRSGRSRGPATPGTLFLQLDGVGHDLLSAAVRGDRPLMPTVARWTGASHRLTPWRTDWSSQTGASQLALLHGSNEDLPAFRWYEKDTRTVVVSNRPSSAAELQRRAIARTGDGGLLAYDGASRGNLFSGGADQVALVMSVAARRGKHNRSRAGYFAYFSDPANATRTAVSFVAEVVREIAQSLRTRFRRELPRVKRGGLYPVIRAFATVVERDVVVAAVVGDLLAGRTAIYADLVAYDEVAHHSGPAHPDALKVLRSLDRAVALIARAARHAPRPYRIVLLSDHGQSHGPTFLERYGLSLGDLVRAGCGLPVPRRAGRTPSGAEARAAARAALHRPEEAAPGEAVAVGATSAESTSGEDAPGEAVAAEAAARPPERTPPDPGAAHPLVLASGNLGLVSFPDVPGRITREELDRRHPALLPTLANHPGIGFLLVRSALHGPVVLGPAGAEHHLRTGRLIGADPLAPFGDGAAEAVRRTDRFPHAADLMVNSACDPDTGAVHAFEEQIGSHGGLGGAQSHPFLLWPVELTPPAPDGAPLTGAEQVHRVLRRWLAEAEGPQLPLRSAADELRPGAPPPEGFPPPDPAARDDSR
ncbi:phage holin family protein [Streptomyces sp. NPDC058773]|uniref:phage holin family protein n=1 Tax=Streptomyces sp. NPDC058773 TaxID=3346632 RepID=UPI003688F8E3